MLIQVETPGKRVGLRIGRYRLLGVCDFRLEITLRSKTPIASAAPTPPTPQRRLRPLDDAAEYWAIHKRSVMRMVRDGKLPAYRVGHLLRIDMNEVEALTVAVAPESVSA